MPRRRTPDPLAVLVGARIRTLRKEQGLTLEKLAYESELGSKGYLSDIESGRALPTLRTLKVLADHLGLELLDLVTFPEGGERSALVDRTRSASAEQIRRCMDQLPAAPRRTGSRRRS